MKNPGYLVQHTDTGKRGRTFNSKGEINGKIPVYYETGKFQFSEKGVLVSKDKLTMVGFID